jgi:hypothetical protein
VEEEEAAPAKAAEVAVAPSSETQAAEEEAVEATE